MLKAQPRIVFHYIFCSTKKLPIEHYFRGEGRERCPTRMPPMVQRQVTYVCRQLSCTRRQLAGARTCCSPFTDPAPFCRSMYTHKRSMLCRSNLNTFGHVKPIILRKLSILVWCGLIAKIKPRAKRVKCWLDKILYVRLLRWILWIRLPHL